MRRVVAVWCLVVVAGMVLAGCGKAKFPKAPVEPVKEFSLGSAKFTPFTKRPTGRELYDRTLELYDSLDSAAVSWRQTGHRVEGLTPGPAPGTGGLGEQTDSADMELRYVSPDKVLLKRYGNSPFSDVTNGDAHLFYLPEQEICFRSRPGSRRHTPPHAVARLLEIIPGDGREYASFRLLRDTKVGDAGVYLLEVKLPGEETAQPRLPGEVRRFYLGKTDLLPRRIEISRLSEDATAGGPESARTYQFSGFVANLRLSDDLFPTKCPENVRTATMPSEAGQVLPTSPPPR